MAKKQRIPLLPSVLLINSEITMSKIKKRYRFYIPNFSDYHLFWITYELLKKAPSATLKVVKNGHKNAIISILNSNLSLLDLKLIFMTNQIDYEKV